jgi:hypothetical protein
MSALYVFLVLALLGVVIWRWHSPIAAWFSRNSTAIATTSLWLLTIITFGYWIPTLVGYERKKDGHPVNLGQVAVMNFFGILTGGILWVIALVFALKKTEVVTTVVMSQNMTPPAVTEQKPENGR